MHVRRGGGGSPRGQHGHLTARTDRVERRLLQDLHLPVACDKDTERLKAVCPSLCVPLPCGEVAVAHELLQRSQQVVAAVLPLLPSLSHNDSIQGVGQVSERHGLHGGGHTVPADM